MISGRPSTSGQDNSAERDKPFRTMHDDCELWTDTCSCEAEPRWQQVAEEMEEAKRNRAEHGDD